MNRSLFLIVIVALIGGGVGAFAKISLGEMPPLSFTFLRFLLAAAILLPFALRAKGFSWTRVGKLVFVSLLATANVTLFIFGVERTTATISQMLYAGGPLVTSMFSVFLLRERLYQRKLWGLIIGFIGVMLIVFLPVIGRQAAFNGDLFGNIIILIAVCSFALYTVLSKRFQENYTPLELTTSFVLTTVVLLLFLAPADAVYHASWWDDVTWKSIIGLLYVGILGTGFNYLLIQYAIQGTTPIVASMTFYLQPIFGYLWAAVLLGEQVTPEFVFGALLAFVGVALVTNFGRAGTQTALAAQGVQK